MDDENIKLNILQYEIFTTRLWKIGYTSYTVYMSKEKIHPLQDIINRNDQYYLKEATKLKNLEDNRPYKIKELEKEADANKRARAYIKKEYGLVPDGAGGFISIEEKEKQKQDREGVQTDFFDELVKQGAIDEWIVDDLRNPKKKSKK